MPVTILESHLADLLPDDQQAVIFAVWHTHADAAGFSDILDEDSAADPSPIGKPLDISRADLLFLYNLLALQPQARGFLEGKTLCHVAETNAEGRTTKRWRVQMTNGELQVIRDERKKRLSLPELRLSLLLPFIILIGMSFGLILTARYLLPSRPVQTRQQDACIFPVISGNNGAAQVGKPMTIWIEASAPCGITKIQWTDDSGKDHLEVLAFTAPNEPLAQASEQVRTRVEWTPDQAGSTELVFRALDSQGRLVASYTMPVTVLPANSDS